MRMDAFELHIRKIERSIIMDFGNCIGMNGEMAKQCQGKEIPLTINVKTMKQLVGMIEDKLSASQERLENLKVSTSPDALYITPFANGINLITCMDMTTGKMAYIGSVNYDLTSFSRSNINGKLVDNANMKIDG